MADTDLRIRTTSEIVDAAFALYRRNVMQYTVVTALGYSPVVMVNLLTFGGVQPTVATPGLIMKALPAALVGMLTFALVSGAIMRMGSDVYLGGEADVARTIKLVLPRVPALLLSSLMFFVMFSVSFLFFLLPSLYVFSRFFAISPAIVLENKGPFGALGRSSVLSDGRKWHILLTLALSWGIYFLLSVGLNLVVKQTGSTVLSLLASSVFAIFGYPIVNLVVMVLYYDTRIRAEGFDVEHMARTLTAPPGLTPFSSPIA